MKRATVDTSEVSVYVFGRRCRLPLALWVLHHDKGRFYQSEPPRELGAPTAVRQELGRLAAVGMLSEERPDAESRVYYVRTESPLWRIIEAADDVLEQ